MRLITGVFLPAAIVFGVAVSGCNRTDPAVAQTPADAANGNLAAADQSTYAQQPQQVAPAQPAAYAPAPQNAAPPPPQYSSTYGSSSYDYSGEPAYGYDDYADGEQVLEAPQPPPPLPEYSQPPCPGEDYLWNPGYWAYASSGYYWVPGVWVLAPYTGAIWTPPYWEFAVGHYRWHRGFWGAHVGFYGGVDYGFGYPGRGFYGGYWNGGQFAYNRAVTNVNTTVIRNVYNYRVNDVTVVNRVSYTGGPGGLRARPTPQEIAVLHEERMAPLAAQVTHAREFEGNRAQFAAVNRGRPAEVVSTRPLQTAYGAPAPQPAAVPNHPRILQPREAPPQVRAQAQQTGGPLPAGRVGMAGREPQQTMPPRMEGRGPQMERGAQQAQQPRQEFRPMMQRPETPVGRPAPNVAAAPQMGRPASEPHEMRPAPAQRSPFEGRPQPAAQARQEFHPAPAPQQARQEFHPAPAPQQARPEFHPAPAPQQARPEFHPAPAPQQARPEFHPAPPPQPARPAAAPPPQARPEVHAPPVQQARPAGPPPAAPHAEQPHPAPGPQGRGGNEREKR